MGCCQASCGLRDATARTTAGPDQRSHGPRGKGRKRRQIRQARAHCRCRQPRYRGGHALLVAVPACEHRGDHGPRTAKDIVGPGHEVRSSIRDDQAESPWDAGTAPRPGGRAHRRSGRTPGPRGAAQARMSTSPPRAIRRSSRARDLGQARLDVRHRGGREREEPAGVADDACTSIRMRPTIPATVARAIARTSECVPAARLLKAAHRQGGHTR